MAKILEKHKKYQDKYGENELFWGLGIEEETYLQFDKPIYVAAPIIRTAHAPERYSVNYYKIYRPCISATFDSTFPDASACIPLPFLINAHALEKMDTFGQHTTTYEKVPKPNPAFSGTTFLTELQAFLPEIYKDLYEKSFVFDGDTIEFITQDFYKVRGPAVIKELIRLKSIFLKGINAYLIAKKIHRDKGLLIYPLRNPGFAVFYSNPQNVVMFNNGTYHINLTLPTLLGPKGDGVAPILYPDEFRTKHRLCIRMIQWLEPLLLAEYGTADPFSFSHDGRYASASQRCAVSRYIGVGTYDTDTMKEGKCLTAAIKDIKGTDSDFWWYKRYHTISAYEPLQRVGMDINYRKHFNHGIELRIFDWFPEGRLQGLIELLVHLCDAALSRDEAPVAVLSPTWNGLVLSILQKGGSYVLSTEESALYERIFGCILMDRGLTVLQSLDVIVLGLKKKYGKGLCSSLML